MINSDKVLNLIITPEDLTDFCAHVLEIVGVKKNESKVAAEIMTNAEMRGVTTHGVSSLPLFVKRIQCGGIDTKAEIEIITQGLNWAIIDGHHGMGQITAFKAANMVVNKAKGRGIAIVGVKNGMHFGAAAYYSMMIAKENMIGISMSNTDPLMAIPGSVDKVIGSNPFSYAAPGGNEKMIVFDTAMSVVAAGKIKLAIENEKSIPLGWILDLNGNPTTNPNDYNKGGMLLPFAGHKGYGFALMVEILAGVITGNALTKDIPGWYDFSNSCPEGFSFIAIDINSFMPIDNYKLRIDNLIRQIKSSSKSEGANRIYIPGEIENEIEERSKINGIILSKSTLISLKNLADDLKIKHIFSPLLKKKIYE